MPKKRADRGRRRKAHIPVLTIFLIVYLSAISGAGLAQIGADRDVYALLLDGRYHAVRASEMSVSDTAIGMRTLHGASDDWLKQFEPVPLALRQQASRTTPTKPHPLDPRQLPPGTKILSASDLKAVFSGGDSHQNWSEFQRRFNSKGWIAFSGVLHTRDGLNALVYYEARCGGLCGEGGYAWLQRDALDGPWRVGKKIVSWMS